MKPESLAIPTYYLHLLAEDLAAEGVDVPRWLAERIPGPPVQLGDAAASLSLDRFRCLLRDATQVVGPDLGLRVGARLRLQHHGVLGYAAMSSSTLRQTAELFQRFCPLRAPLVPSFTQTEGGEFRFVFEDNPFLADIGPLMYEAAVLGMKNVFEQVAGGRLGKPVHYVAFAFGRPAYGPSYTHSFDCPVHFSQGWTGLALPLAAVDLPLPGGDPVAYREALHLCEREMDTLAWQEGWAARVRRLLQAGEDGIPSLAAVAEALHLSPRTLHRRLLAEDTSFKALLEESLHRRARVRLRMAASSIQEVAFELGYTDVANFRRAFKRWEGMAPSVYRAASLK